MFYRSEGKSVCADVIPFYENGEFKLFYLKDFRDAANHGEGCPWCLLTTKDLVHYKDYGEVLPRGTQNDQDLYVFTGCCVKMKGEYRIYYTGHNPHKRAQSLAEEKILLAVSKDGIHFKKQEDFVFEAPDWLEMHDFRDPFVFYDEEKKHYVMLLAGRIRSEAPVHYKGGTFAAISADGEKWELSKTPYFFPQAYYTHECPDLFKIGNWWYLVFSEFTDKISTRYVMSENLDGEWRAPANDLFDGHAFYAAKSVSDGKRRIIFGWNGIKNEERDDEPCQWGGTIIPNEIVQLEDGSLGVRCPDEIREQYSLPYAYSEGYRQGRIEKSSADSYELGANALMSILMLGKLPERCKIEAKFTASDIIGDFGIILNENGNHNNFYKVKFEPKFNRLCFDKLPRLNNNLHCNVDTERYCPIKPGEENTLLIIIEGSVLEVYVNDCVCMGARMFDSRNGNFGLYAHNTSVKFKDLLVFTEKDL